MNEDLNDLPELTDDEQAALGEIPDDAVAHWLNDEKWDFKTKTWRTKFTCVDCGESFESLAPPAETRWDDPEPTCGPCLEKMLDDVDAEPLDDETIERIMAKVLLTRPPE